MFGVARGARRQLHALPNRTIGRSAVSSREGQNTRGELGECESKRKKKKKAYGCNNGDTHGTCAWVPKVLGQVLSRAHTCISHKYSPGFYSSVTAADAAATTGYATTATTTTTTTTTTSYYYYYYHYLYNSRARP